MTDGVVEYDSTENPTLDDFHCDDNFVRGILGPFGSGKSVACSMETVLRANEQKPLKKSIYRPVKWAIVRNSYGELEDTTIATYQEWVPPEMGHWISSKHKFTAEWDHPSGDGTIVEMECLFRALDKPKDARKLLSLEVTGAWFNEAREIPWGVIDLMQGRCGRFPPSKHGGATWDGIWIDTNPPDEDSQFYHVFEELRPEGYKLFRQPSGLASDAENVHNLKPGYYDRLTRGKTQDWIDVYINAQYGFVIDGKPIYPEYNDRLHCADEIIPYVPGEPIYLGMDFGLTPACVFVQAHAGTYYAIDEIVTEDMGAVGFIEVVSERLRGVYRSSPVSGWGDPAGDQRSAIRESETVFKIIQQAGIPVDPASTQDPVMRRESVAKLLRSLNFDGRPRLIISPTCKYLRKGLRGGYCYKRLNVSGGDRYRDKPDKTIYSHVCFVAGTHIATQNGSRPVESLRVGDLVRTPIGLRPVTAIGVREAPTVTLSLSDGSTLQCTPDHPFWSDGGYRHADALEYSYLTTERDIWQLILWKLNHYAAQLNTRFMSFKASGTISSRQDITRRRRVRTSTGQYGNTIMGRYRKVITSIMSTAIEATTDWQTLNSWMGLLMFRFTCPSQTISNDQRIAWPLPSMPLPSGGVITRTKPKRLGCWVPKGFGEKSQRQSELQLRARTAGPTQACYGSLSQDLPIVQRTASQRLGKLAAWTMLAESASCAVSRLLSINMLKRKRVRVVAVQRSAGAPVHNITVDDAHAYYAGGALVSNCEGLEYLCIGLGLGYDLIKQPSATARKPRVLGSMG